MMKPSNVRRLSGKPRRRIPGWLIIPAAGIVLSTIMLVMLVAIPALSPGTGALVADALRAAAGPTPVAMLESVSSRIQDIINRLRYEATGGQPQLTWTTGPLPAPNPSPLPDAGSVEPAAPVASSDAVVSSQGQVFSQRQAPSQGQISSQGQAPSQEQASNQGQVPSGEALAQPAQRPMMGGAALVPLNPPPDVVADPPVVGAGWQPFGPQIDNKPVMARTSLKPDSSRPYAQAAVVRIDLTRTRLHLVAGTFEPIAAPGLPRFPRPGVIPADVQTGGSLLAAFNGGFKAVNGHYGMLVDGVTILPPIDKLATLALYQDGSVRIGAWGRDITPSPDLVAYRQNCPLLVDAGQINPTVNSGSRAEWGFTVHNLDTTWRSGLGISRDGQFLIYAAGNSLTVQSLADALQTAGAYYAMQLDINGAFTIFDTFQPAQNAQSSRPVVAVKLLNEMVGGPRQFLVPDKRDFFYVTAAQSGYLNAPASPVPGS